MTGYERVDGAGRSWDIVIQGFIRGVTLGFFPVIICASVLYLLVSVIVLKDTNFLNKRHLSFLLSW